MKTAIPYVIAGSLLGGFFLTARENAPGAATSDGAMGLANALSPTQKVTPADLERLAGEIRSAGGDAELASALEVTAGEMRSELALPPGGEPVSLQSWAEKVPIFFAEPSVMSAFVDVADTSSLRAIERTPTGWSRVQWRQTPGLVLDPTVQLSVWVRTADLIPKRPTLVAGPFQTIRLARNWKEVGLWVVSPQGRAIVSAGIGVAAAAFPPAVIALPIFNVIVELVKAAVDILLQTIEGIVKYNADLDQAILGAFMYQLQRVGTALMTNPKIVEQISKYRFIGDLKLQLSSYIGDAFANTTRNTVTEAILDITKPIGLDPRQIAIGERYRDAIKAYRDGVLPDAAFGKYGLTPRLRVDELTPSGVTAREDAVAMGLNMILNRPIYDPDWFDAATGRFLADPNRLREFITYEYTRGALTNVPYDKRIHFERVSILNAELNRIKGRSVLRSPVKHSGAKVPTSADELLNAYNAARVEGRPQKTIDALHAAYKRQLALETTWLDEEKRRADDAYRTQAAREEAANATLTPTPTPINVAVPAPVNQPESSGSALKALALSALLTSPIWYPKVRKRL